MTRTPTTTDIGQINNNNKKKKSPILSKLAGQRRHAADTALPFRSAGSSGPERNKRSKPVFITRDSPKRGKETNWGDYRHPRPSVRPSTRCYIQADAPRELASPSPRAQPGLMKRTALTAPIAREKGNNGRGRNTFLLLLSPRRIIAFGWPRNHPTPADDPFHILRWAVADAISLPTQFSDVNGSRDSAPGASPRPSVPKAT